MEKDSVIHLLKNEKISSNFITNFSELDINNIFLLFDNGVVTIGDGIDQRPVENFHLENVLREFNISKLLVHGLFPEFTALIRKIPKNISIGWFVWGFDIYNQDIVRDKLYATQTSKLYLKSNKNGIRRKIKNFPLFRNLYHKIMGTVDYQSDILYAYQRTKYFCSYIEEDFLFFDKFYKHSTEFFYTPFCTIDQYLGGNHNLRVNKTASHILLGNSNSIENNHLDAIAKLKDNDCKSIIYVPLSYGTDMGYRKCVVEFGKDQFDTNFVPLIDFMPLPDYLNLISECSVAIFYHFRQQAMGNIIALLYMGMRIYLSKNNPVYNYCKRIGLEVYDFDSDFNLFGTKVLEEELAEKNREVLRNNFSSEKVKYYLAGLVEKL